MNKKLQIFYLLPLLLITCISGWGQDAEKVNTSSLNKCWQPNGVFYGRSPKNEIIGYRTNRSKTFQNADGTNTIVFGGAVHYKDENGKWREINSSIITNHSGKHAESKYANTASDIKTYFPETPGKGVYIDYRNQELSFGYNPQIKLIQNGNVLYSQHASSTAEATINGNTLSYNSIYDGINQELTVLDNSAGIQNNFIIHHLSPALSQNSNADLEISQFIPLSAGWKVYRDSSATSQDFTAASFYIKNEDTAKAFVFNPILIYDNTINNEVQALAVVQTHSARLNSNQKYFLDHIWKGNYKVHFVQGGIEVSYVVNNNALRSKYLPVTLANTGTIGSSDGNIYQFWDGYYIDTRLQSLYLASDFTSAGLSNGDAITAIGVYHTTYGTCTGNHTLLKIRMQNTASSTLGTAYTNSGYSNVYSGTQNITNTNGWITNTFSSNYTFDNTQNMIIDFTMNNTTRLCPSGNTYWGMYSVANRGIYTASTTDLGDPQSKVSGAASAWLPYLQITYTSSIQPPTNDDCSGAQEIIPNSTCNYVAGTTEGATQSIAGAPCSGTVANDVWYKFTATASTATVTVQPSSGFDAVFELRNGACNGTSISDSYFYSSCMNIYSSGGQEFGWYTGLTIGSTYYIRVWDFNAGSANTFSVCVTAPCTVPSSSASSIVLSGTGCTQTTVSWTKGTGSRRILVGKAGSAVTGTPANSTDYNANTTFGSGDAIASGEYVLYNGSSNSVTITDLSPSTTYYFKVFESVCTGTNVTFKTTSVPTATITTSAAPSAAGAITGTALLLYGQTAVSYSVAAISGATSYGWDYSGSGFNCATGCASNRITADFPCSASSGILSVHGINACGNGTASSYSITLNPPLTTASSVNFTGVSCTQMTINWTNGSGAKRIVVIKAGSAVNGTPADNTTYTASTAYGSGSTIATGEYVVYNNSSNSVTVTNLAPGVTYYVKIFEYSCSAGTEKYNTVPATGNKTTNPLPSSAGTISGTASVTAGQAGVSYSVPAITNATSYVWSYSQAGFTCAGGCTSNSITANFACSAISGALTVYGSNACGIGATSPDYAIAVTASGTSNAGTNQYICAATPTATMSATGTGTWTMISGGPITPNIVNANSPTTQIGTIIPLTTGTYVFRWSSGCAYDDVVIVKE